MTEIPKNSDFMATGSGRQGGGVLRVGVVDTALGGPQQLAALAALFPQLRFETVGSSWPDDNGGDLSALIVSVDAADSAAVDAAVRRLRTRRPGVRIVIVLHGADVTTTRLLIREGCADVVPAPATEASLALSLDALFADSAASTGGPRQGQIVAVLKAGGGVGATSVAVQTGALIAATGTSACVADLDLQFGAAGLYLDLPEAATVLDCMSAGAALQDMALADTLAKHRTGLHLLAAPRRLTPLEAVSAPQMDSLATALRKAFEVTVLDLPSVWTAWTNRALQLADRIVIVTQLSIPHLHMVDRQVQVLKTQGFDTDGLTLVCNALAPEQTGSLSLKTAERALKREFAVVIPEDRKLLYAAINQGAEISAIRRGTKVEKALLQLRGILAPVSAEPAKRRR